MRGLCWVLNSIYKASQRDSFIFLCSDVNRKEGPAATADRCNSILVCTDALLAAFFGKLDGTVHPHRHFASRVVGSKPACSGLTFEADPCLNIAWVY